MTHLSGLIKTWARNQSKASVGQNDASVLRLSFLSIVPSSQRNKVTGTWAAVLARLPLAPGSLFFN